MRVIIKMLAIFPVVQCILVAYFISNSLYLLFPHLCIASPLFHLPTGNHSFVLCTRVCFRFAIFACYISDSTWKWHHVVFPCLAHFTRLVCVCCAHPCERWAHPMGCSLPGTPVPGIFQARTVECVASSSSRDLSDLGVEPGSPALLVDSLPLHRLGSPSLRVAHFKSVHVGAVLLYPGLIPRRLCGHWRACLLPEM